MVTSEAKKASWKKYRDSHKSERTAYSKEYRKTHAIEIAEYRWSPDVKKQRCINTWKQNGVIHNDFDSLYEDYFQATHCSACKIKFKDTTDRCLDHNHDTGLFRQFLCRGCNSFDRWKSRTVQ